MGVQATEKLTFIQNITEQIILQSYGVTHLRHVKDREKINACFVCKVYYEVRKFLNSYEK